MRTLYLIWPSVSALVPGLTCSCPASAPMERVTVSAPPLMAEPLCVAWRATVTGAVDRKACTPSIRIPVPPTHKNHFAMPPFEVTGQRDQMRGSCSTR